MSFRTFTALTALKASALLLATLSITALVGCDAPSDEISPRAVVISDGWGTHEPVSFPEVNSCEDYWNDRCAELSPASCGYLKARYSCSSADQGVVITDHFGDAPAAAELGGWRVATGKSGFSTEVADTPAGACSTLADDQIDACLELAAAVEVAPELRKLAPNGGVGSIAAGKLEPLLIKGDAMVAALAPLDWEIPALTKEFRLAVAGSIVIEDVIMLMAAPDGTLAASGKDIVLIRDVRVQMDKVEVCVDVDP